MKLTIKRNQRDVKGFLGGHKGVRFEISATAQLTSEERKLCEQYLPGSIGLFTWEYTPRQGVPPTVRSVTVDSLMKGQSFECESLDDIINLQKGLITGANNLNSYIEVASSFGGQIEISIPSVDTE